MPDNKSRSSTPAVKKTTEETGTEAPDKLFVYGSLNDGQHLQLVTGHILPSRPAILLNHRRIVPKNGFPFALRWEGSKMEGSLLYGITPDILRKIDDYEAEGELFTRKTAEVQVDGQPCNAFVYLGISKALKPYFKKISHHTERIEEYVEQYVNRYIEERADRTIVLDRESLPIKVTRELLSEEVHNIMRQYFQESGLPPFIIRHELEKASIPSLKWVTTDRKAQKYADNYIALAVKFMIFNQLEEKFREDYRRQVKVSDSYYMHSISALLALKMIVEQRQQIQTAMMHLGINRYNPSLKYTDYTVAAIFIADELYRRDLANSILRWFKSNRHVGQVPIGAELEFSNVGVRATEAAEGEDPMFDSFYYFYDFDLMRRGWKLGAHVDDHGFLSSRQTRTRGFLELAFGRYKLLGDVSKPATQDPWVLSQLIELSIRVLKIRPHSLHVSLQVSSVKPFTILEEPDYLLCLLLLGGDLRQDKTGTLREMRIFRGEIVLNNSEIYLSRLNRHRNMPEDRSWSQVVEYQFARLNYDYDYQPLIMALKGFQYEANPYPLKEVKDCPCKKLYADIEKTLLEWATSPTPIGESTIESFLRVVETGLDKEGRVQGTDYARYAQRVLGRIEEQLKQRNQRIRDQYVYTKQKPDRDSSGSPQ